MLRLQEDKENFCNSVRTEVKATGLLDTTDNCWDFFIDKVRQPDPVAYPCRVNSSACQRFSHVQASQQCIPDKQRRSGNIPIVLHSRPKKAWKVSCHVQCRSGAICMWFCALAQWGRDSKFVHGSSLLLSLALLMTTSTHGPKRFAKSLPVTHHPFLQH